VCHWRLDRQCRVPQRLRVADQSRTRFPCARNPNRNADRHWLVSSQWHPARRTLFETELNSVTAQGQLAQAGAKLDGFLLSGGLDATVDSGLDDALRGQTLDGQ
jgi:hypothetical protein